MIENTIKALDFKLKIVEDAYLQAVDNSQEDSKSSYVNYHSEVAFFLHYIYSNEATKQVFRELLKYDENLFLSNEYKDLITEICALFRNVSEIVTDEIGINNLPDEINDGWKNPFGTLSSIQATDLIVSLKTYDEIPKVKESKVLNEIYSVLVSIFERWDSHVSSIEWGNVFNLMNSVHKLNSKLDYLTGFLKEQSGANCAIRLLNLYRAISPMGIPQSIRESFFHTLVVSGNKLTNDKVYVTDCRKIAEHIKQKLLEGASINISINQAITFMENFRTAADYPEGEKQLQKEFETLLYQRGYFPLSEVHLKNGRLDTLAVNGSNAFLIEYKQIGWTKSELGLKTELKKINSAFIQSDIYSKRLSIYPRLNKTIHLIIFTTKYIIFKNGNSSLQYNGLSFNFYTVYLGADNPSTIKKPIIYDVESVLSH